VRRPNELAVTVSIDVKAATEGALFAGADGILMNDSHDGMRNIRRSGHSVRLNAIPIIFVLNKRHNMPGAY